MGDELVRDVVDSLDDVLFANSITASSADVIVDTLLNRLRDGMSDDAIRALLIPEQTAPAEEIPREREYLAPDRL